MPIVDNRSIMHAYEIESHGINWEVYAEDGEYLSTMEPMEFDYFIKNTSNVHVIRHTLAEYEAREEMD